MTPDDLRVFADALLDQSHQIAGSLAMPRRVTDLATELAAGTATERRISRRLTTAIRG